MSYYIRTFETADGQSTTQAWKIDADTAVCLGVSNPEHGAGTYYRVEAGKNIWETLRHQTPWFLPDSKSRFHETVLKPGQYYPRMARPFDHKPYEVPDECPGAQSDANFIAGAQGQLATLVRQLDRICQTVQPVPANYSSFGHDIRNLLILACTEVESHWRGILKANGVVLERPTTNDYVKLRCAMRLGEYAVRFPSYPWIEPIHPFAGWGSSRKPSQDLVWYGAYNAIKHDLENEFPRANLANAFAAIAGCAVMMVAQFGLANGLGRPQDIWTYFDISEVPKWHPSDVYMHPYGEAPSWQAAAYPF
jgi:hypothetical protein